MLMKRESAIKELEEEIHVCVPSCCSRLQLCMKCLLNLSEEMEKVSWEQQELPFHSALPGTRKAPEQEKVYIYIL